MSEDLQALQHQIEGAQKVESIVKTMKALAASQIHVYEEALRSLELYKKTVDLGLVATLRNKKICFDEGIKSRHHKKLMIAFGTDQGLVGQFNERLSQKLDSSSDIFFLVGERLFACFSDEHKKIHRFSLPLTLTETTVFIEKVLIECEQYFETNDLFEVEVCFHKPNSSQNYEFQIKRILPLDELWINSYVQQCWPTKNIPEVIGDKTLSGLKREYLFISLFHACVCSLASENLARLLGMQRAQKNIEELLVDLKLGHNRLRQNMIDSELFDVIAGFNALSKVE